MYMIRNYDISVKESEIISISTGDYDNHSSTPYIVLKDFTFYDILIEYIKRLYQQNDGSYKLNDHITMQPSTNIDVVVDYFRDGGYSNAIAFQRHLVEMEYIKPNITRGISFGSEDELEIYEYLEK